MARVADVPPAGNLHRKVLYLEAEILKARSGTRHALP
jgi:hypothetical protein